MDMDVPRLVHWVEPLFNDFKSAMAAIAGNAMTHKDELMADLIGIPLDWSFKNYTRVGEDVADCLYLIAPVGANYTLPIDTPFEYTPETSDPNSESFNVTPWR